MPTEGTIRIPARNRKQTMDWALVLASQGIGATIVHDAEGVPGWGLMVAAADHEAAVRSIRLYRLENRHWHWRQPLVWRGVVFDWKVLCWALFVSAFYWLSLAHRDLSAAGRMDNAAVRAGEWWRLFTAMEFHADIGHLAMNVTLGVVLLGLAMGRYGSGTGLLFACLAGAGGNVAGLLCYPPSHLGVGASGMVLGALGLLAAQSVRAWRTHPVARSGQWKSLIAGVLLFVWFGLSPEPNVDVIAHAGGFLTGFCLGSLWWRLPARWQNPKTDAAAGILLAVITGLTCWLAFR